MRLLRLALVICLACASPVSAQAPADPAMQEADELLAAKQWAKAADAYEAIGAREPGTVRAWARAATASHSLGAFERAIANYEKAIAAAGGVAPQLTYNLACSQARSGKTDAAFASLEKAYSGGFSNLTLLASDEDLASLRVSPRWAGFQEEARRLVEPCRARPESRQFDFWVGTWDVQTTTGQPAGENRIDLILGDCVLLENWTSRGGGSGKSMNLFNTEQGYWQQTWVDAKGGVTEFRNGRYENGVMRFTAESKGPQGEPVLQKLAFFNLEPGKVRQLGETSGDGGKTWTVSYDLIYVKRK